MSMNRSLGEGKITKITKKSAILNCERLGCVTFPLNAANVSNNDCYDLREKYSQDEMLIFTAQKQSGDSTNARYVASSVVKRRELLSCTGKIVECYEKFCYGVANKYGRVFIPYSARIESNNVSKAWLGKGAEINRAVTMKIFRQPDINNCRYVAWSLSLSDSQPPLCFPSNLPSIASSNGLSTLNGTSTMSRLPTTNGQLRGAEKMPEIARDQVGVIVTFINNEECNIYSAQTGLSQVKVKSWMELGGFVKYDAIKLKNLSTESKIHWAAQSVTDIGFMYEVLEDNMDVTRLHLNVKAIVNRVSVSSRAAWLWNDYIGRIYVPPAVFNRNLRPLMCVEIRALYTGAFEDVPWSALSVKVVDADRFDEVRIHNSQLLLTDDRWTVKFIQSQPQTFYGFMDNPMYGSAFIAWTDLNDGDTPPPQNSRCRATVYFQQRDGKHAWRAVLVTQLDENLEPISPHNMYLNTGKRITQEPFAPPHVAPSVTPMPPPGLPPVPNQWNRGNTSNRASAAPAPPSAAPAPPSAVAAAPSPIARQIDVTQPPPQFVAPIAPIARQHSSVGVIGSGLLQLQQQQQQQQPIGSPAAVVAPISPPGGDDSPRPLSLLSPSMDDVFSAATPNYLLEQRANNDWCYNIWADIPSSTTSATTANEFARWCNNDTTNGGGSGHPGSGLSTSTSDDMSKSHFSTQIQSQPKECVLPFQPNQPVDFSAILSSSQLNLKCDQATQTDTLVEEKILRDIMTSKDLRFMLVQKFPDFFDRIMDLKF